MMIKSWIKSMHSFALSLSWSFIFFWLAATTAYLITVNLF